MYSQQIAWGISFKTNFSSNNNWTLSYHVYKAPFIYKANSIVVAIFSSRSTLKRKKCTLIILTVEHVWKTVQYLSNVKLINGSINKIYTFKILQIKPIHLNSIQKKENNSLTFHQQYKKKKKTIWLGISFETCFPISPIIPQHSFHQQPLTIPHQSSSIKLNFAPSL